MATRIIVTIVFVALYVDFFWAIFYWFFWFLIEHPFILFAAIVVGGLPVLYLTTLNDNREIQRQFVWSSLESEIDSRAIKLQTFSDDEESFVSATIDDVRFRLLKIRVSKGGIYLSRPLAASKPLRISWDQVQRVDPVKYWSKRMKGWGKQVMLSFINSDRIIVLNPWEERLQRMVPDRIGQMELQART